MPHAVVGPTPGGGPTFGGGLHRCVAEAEAAADVDYGHDATDSERSDTSDARASLRGLHVEVSCARALTGTNGCAGHGHRGLFSGRHKPSVDNTPSSMSRSSSGEDEHAARRLSTPFGGWGRRRSQPVNIEGKDAEENMRNDTWGAPDADGRVWNRKSFPLITAGSIDIFASRKSCNVHIQRNRGNILSDHLEFMVTCSPLTALMFCTLEYCILVCLFSVFYYLGGDTCCDNRMDARAALHFSIHTMTTAGYGVVAPFSLYCNSVVVAHCWATTIFIALVTSILLLNITRPNVDVVFSENAIICNVDSKDPKKPPELHFQILKDSNYSVANVEISANLWDYSAWPTIKRQALVLGAPTLSWMEYGIHNVHVVDKKSPLRPIVNQIRESGTIPNSFNILVTMNCVQSATGSVLTRMYSYCHPNIQSHKRFKPLLVDMGDFIALRPVAESHELIDEDEYRASKPKRRDSTKQGFGDVTNMLVTSFKVKTLVAAARKQVASEAQLDADTPAASSPPAPVSPAPVTTPVAPATLAEDEDDIESIPLDEPPREKQ